MLLVEQMFNQLYVAGAEYRSTTVVLGRLESDRQQQYELFDDQVRIERMRNLGKVGWTALTGATASTASFWGRGWPLEAWNSMSATSPAGVS